MINMENTTQLVIEKIDAYFKWQENFDPDFTIEFTRDHLEVRGRFSVWKVGCE